ncbi:MAG: hypothetical protein J7L11_11045 [Thermoprotei archaeon]|nr:hypothetical protein [Thermoprotei archaeon]
MAWLIDSLKEKNRAQEIPVISGNAEILSRLVGMSGAFIGGLIAEYSLELPFAMGAFLCFAVIIPTLP